jgi:hypothetical protein
MIEGSGTGASVIVKTPSPPSSAKFAWSIASYPTEPNEVGIK